MSAIIHTLSACSIEQEIEQHSAWLGRVSGLAAEKMLRGQKRPYLYVLRAGESENDYYVTYVDSNFAIIHQPFVITVKCEGWYFENGCAGGPFTEASIDDVLHLIMHCNKDAMKPFIS